MKHKKRYIHLAECMERAKKIAYSMTTENLPQYRIYGVPRGGLTPAALVAFELRSMLVEEIDVLLVTTAHVATHIIDDILDSGATRDSVYATLEGYVIPFYTLYEAADHEEWLVFPWEVAANGADKSAEDIPIRLLQYIGEDVHRGGLLETPKRFVAAWGDYSMGYRYTEDDVAALLKTFEDGGEACDDMVVQTNIPVYSHCEHHLAPFFGVAHIAYIPNGRIVGLSKFSRLVDVYAKRLQVQERLTNQIAEALQTHLKPKGVAVVLQCRHLCMEARGVRQQGTSTTTSAMKGVFREDQAVRDELMRLIK